MLKNLRRWFITGVVLLAPTYVTVIVILWLFNHLDAPLRTLIGAVLPRAALPGIGVVGTLAVIILAGAVATTFIVKRLFTAFENLLYGIPLIRTLYSGVKQLLSPFSPEESAQLQRVVVVEWPSEDLYALGFLVKPEACRDARGRMLSSVLLPSNHLHLGNVVLVPQSNIYPVDMSIEEGLKFLVSMGAALDRPIELERRPVGIEVGSSPDLPTQP